ncbi:acyl carrier protein [bacterium]|nr:acyl carrier protein [bacterium]
MSKINEAVRGFLAGLCDVDSLSDDDDIFAGGFVNSLYLVQMLNFIQSEFSIELDEDDYDMANFRSLNAIETFINEKQKDQQ